MLGGLLEKPWIWSFVAAFLVWVATIAFTGGQGGGELLTAALTFATFFVIVGIGQMFVITLGPGNVDLSIPATMTLAGSVAMKIMDTQDSMILRRPPRRARLRARRRHLQLRPDPACCASRRSSPPCRRASSSCRPRSPMAAACASSRRRCWPISPPSQIAGIPVLAIVVALLAALMGVVLHRTIYGRSVLAIGQSQRAAGFAGIRVERIRFLTYVLSAVLAALCGYLFSGFSGGSSLSMGEQYLLASIAVVVIGGTSVAGGNGNLPGLWGAALFLFLVQSMLNTYQLSAGLRYLATGLIIIAVIVAAGGQKAAR